MMNRWVMYLLFLCLCPIPIQGQDTAEEAIARLRSLRMARNAKDGYVNKAGIQGFPTTWFLNREGQIAFLKLGWTKELEEEFGWRIEALRGVEVK